MVRNSWLSPSMTAMPCASRSVTSIRLLTLASWRGLRRQLALFDQNGVAGLDVFQSPLRWAFPGGAADVLDQGEDVLVGELGPHGGITVPGFPLVITSMYYSSSCVSRSGRSAGPVAPRRSVPWHPAQESRKYSDAGPPVTVDRLTVDRGLAGSGGDGGSGSEHLYLLTLQARDGPHERGGLPAHHPDSPFPARVSPSPSVPVRIRPPGRAQPPEPRFACREMVEREIRKPRGYLIQVMVRPGLGP